MNMNKKRCNIKFTRLPWFKVDNLSSSIYQPTCIMTRDVDLTTNCKSLSMKWFSGFSCIDGLPHALLVTNTKYFVDISFEI